MSLLTPSEHHAFQSFLSAVDNANHDSLPDRDAIPPEWKMYAADGAVDHIPIPELPREKEALAKATKDLMSLDAYSTTPRGRPSSAGSFTARNGGQTDRPSEAGPSNDAQPPRPQVATDVYGASAFPQTTRTLTHPQSSASPVSRIGASRPTASKRSITEPSVSNKRHQPSPSNTLAASTGSNTPVHTHPTSPIPRTSASAPTKSKSVPRPAVTIPQPPSKLLTASQKKANHIQSEQKRRANIRRGYEALSETVPALRDAIRALEGEPGGQTVNVLDGGDSENRDGVKTRAKRRRARTKAADEGEKIDGRAGPRSEGVVLQKTIEYIQELLQEREELYGRLVHARHSLPPGHTALEPSRPLDANGVPGETLWEREWTGGTGMHGDDDGDSDEEAGE